VNNVVTVSFTREPNDTNFEYNAHTRGTTAKDVFYMGAYKGYVSSSKLYSSSGKTPGSTHTITEFRTYAQARGTGYEQLGWYQLIYIQCVYLMIFQNLNSQATIGYGYVHPDNTASVKTGNTNAYGMNCELIKATNPTYMTDKKHQVKCLGIEDCWGNKWVFIDGLVVNSSYKILTANSSFNNTGSGYTNNGAIGATKEIVSLYIKTPVGTTKTGFLLKTDNGDTSTQYFCDRGQIKAGYIPIHGGRWLGNVAAGIFETALDASTTTSSINTGARLMYL
jgi:hypothetical protein